MQLAGLLQGDRRDWLRHAWSGNPWSYQTPRDQLEIAPVVSPLRFDITIRLAFIRHYMQSRELYREDFDQFARLAREHDYYVWFREIMCVNWQPHVLADEGLFAAAWAERLRAVAELVESFERTGFDRRFPITLYTGREIRETETGKRILRDVYSGDGNHRIAMLLAAGESVLRPGQYRIKRFRRLAPIDTTPELLRLLDVSEERYLEFLRQGYPHLRISEGDGNIEIEPADTPDALEARSVYDIDNAHLEGRTP